jgi:hypothetical protein
LRSPDTTIRTSSMSPFQQTVDEVYGRGQIRCVAVIGTGSGPAILGGNDERATVFRLRIT